MIGKKINQLATELAPATTDLTIIGNPVTGVSKKITLSQIANLFATSGTVTSVAVTETGNALTITGSPITTAGTINIGFAGAATQYVRGDGQLSDFPTSTGGGSSVSYYLNSSVSQGTLGGVAYRQFSKTPIAGAGTDISVSANGYIASYITDANDPALLEVPAGNFNCEFYFSVNSNNHNPYVYAEVYKYDGTTFTLLGSSQSVPEYLTFGTTLSPYYFAVPVTATVLTITDRIAIRIYANVDGRTVTLHTENSHLCQVVTTFSKGLTSLNNLTRQVQFLATGTSGTDFNIASSTATHTFNLPTASATNRGALSSADWTTFNNKQNALTNPITGTGASGQVAFFNGTTSLTGTNNFFWDTTNNRLGIGLTNPQRSIEIFNSTADNHLRLSGNAPSVSMGEAVTGSVYQAKFGLVTVNGQFAAAGLAGDFVIISQTGATIFVTNSTEKMRVQASGNMCVGNTNDTYKLDVTGTGRYTGQLRLESTITDGTNTYTLPSATGTLALTSQLTGGTVTSVGLSSATSGVTIGSTPITTSGTITLAIATASGSQNGLLSSTDWTTFNGKQNSITLTTTGSSGAATLVGSTLNIPNYGSALSGYVTLDTTQTITGLKTFSSDITGQSNIYVTNIEGGVYANYFGIYSTGSTPLSFLYGSTGSVVWNNGGAKMTLSSAGALELVSSISATSATLNGNVIINSTAAALSPLQVVATGTIVRLGEQSGTTGKQFLIGIDATSGRTELQSVWQGTSFTSLALQPSGGNVLIGTTGDNGAKLQVSGTATFSSSVGINGVSAGANGEKLKVAGAVYIDAAESNTIFTSGAFLITPGTYNNFRQTTSHDLVIDTYNGGNILTPFTLKQNGNVGIGTSTPSQRLTIAQTNGYPVIDFNNSGTTYGDLGFQVDKMVLSSYSTTPLTFWTNGTERMRITSGGNVGIGTTNPLALLHIQSAEPTFRITDSSDGGVTFIGSTGGYSYIRPFSRDFKFINAAGSSMLTITSGGAVLMGIGTNSASARLALDAIGMAVYDGGNYRQCYMNGSTMAWWNGSNQGTLTSAGVWTNASDISIKKDVVDIKYGLDAVLELKPRSYKMKNDDLEQVGFIAQEVEQVIAELVSTDNKGMKGLSYGQLTAVLVKAIQELTQKVNELENKIK